MARSREGTREHEPDVFEVQVLPRPREGERLPNVFEVLPGLYDLDGRNHGKPLYRKRRRHPDDRDMILYFWDPVDEVDGDDEDASGWRFGQSVGGRDAWAWSDQGSELPNGKVWTPKLTGREREQDIGHELLVEPKRAASGSRRSASARGSQRSIDSRAASRHKHDGPDSGGEAEDQPAQAARNRPRQPFANRRLSAGKKCVNLSGKKMDDAALEKWVNQDGAGLLKELGSHPRLDTLDVSANEMTDEGLHMLIDFLRKNKVGVRRMRLFANKLRNPSAVGWMIEDKDIGAGMYLRELHLSDNNLSVDALGKILDSLRHQADFFKGFDPPFWLRAEQNEALAGLEKEIVQEHKGKGLRLCTEAGSKTSACKLQRCQFNADVHLYLERRPHAAAKRKLSVGASDRNGSRSGPVSRSYLNHGDRQPSLHKRSRSAGTGATPEKPQDWEAESKKSRRSSRGSTAEASARTSVALRARERSPANAWHRNDERHRSRSRSRQSRGGYSPHADRAAESAGRTWSSKKDGPREVVLHDKGFDDDAIGRWCAQEGPRLMSEWGTGSWDRLDLSKNSLTDRGVDILVKFLLDRRQAVVRLVLYMNKLVSPDAVCRLVEDADVGAFAHGGLAELHLSSNAMTVKSLKSILDSLRRRAREVGRIRQPIWFRAERNAELEDEGGKLAKDYWYNDFKVCLDGGTKSSGCTLKSCRYGAHVHLHLHGANRGNRAAARGGRGW